MSITLFDEENLPRSVWKYERDKYWTLRTIGNLKDVGLNDMTMSCYIYDSGTTILYEHAHFSGHSSILAPGYHPTPEAMDMPARSLSSVRTLPKAEGRPVIHLFEHADYGGGCMSIFTNHDASSLKDSQFNDCATSVIVEGNGAWECFEHSDYRGKRWVLGPGRYRNSVAAGIGNDKISSVRYLGV